MDDQLKATLSGLIAKVEALQGRNAELEAQNVKLHDQAQACGKTVVDLLKKVEDLKSINGSLNVQVQRSSRPVKPDYRKRPPVMRGRTVQSNVGCGPLYITLNEDESGKPFEVFFKLGKSGSCQQSYLEALGVAMSVGLRYGADPEKFVEKFEGMRCPNPKMRDSNGPSTLSCADGISQGLAKALALAFPIADVQARAEADVVAVAEPRAPIDPIDAHESAANARSIDLIAGLAHPVSAPQPGNGNGNGHTTNGNGHGSGATAYGASYGTGAANGGSSAKPPNVRKAMMTGVGMCPKCGGNLISQGGCIQCLQQCGYIGKCS